jgi:hypothetical protein
MQSPGVRFRRCRSAIRAVLAFAGLVVLCIGVYGVLHDMHAIIWQRGGFGISVRTKSGWCEVTFASVFRHSPYSATAADVSASSAPNRLRNEQLERRTLDTLLKNPIGSTLAIAPRMQLSRSDAYLDIESDKNSLDFPPYCRTCLVVFPVWFDLIVGAILVTPMLLFWRRNHRLRRRIREGRCRTCGYDLRGSVSSVCPECGVPAIDSPGAGFADVSDG